METYLIQLKKEGQTWTATCPSFNVACDAAEPEYAVRGCRRMCVEEGRKILLEGGRLPEDDGSSYGMESASGIVPVLAEFHLEEEYQASDTTPVRRTVSLPGWLDKRLRFSGVDASRLFQDAAVEHLRRLDTERKGVPKISDWRDLEDACAPGVLDEFLAVKMEELASQINDVFRNLGGYHND